MASAVIHHLLHPLTCEGGSQITKEHFLYSLGITFAELVFTSWAAWPISLLSNLDALFIGTCTVITFYTCTAVFKTYVYTGSKTSQGSADAGRSSENGVTPNTISATILGNQPPSSKVTTEEIAYRLIDEINEGLSELSIDMEDYWNRFPEDLKGR